MTYLEMPPIPGGNKKPRVGQLGRLEAKGRLEKAKEKVKWVKSGWENTVAKFKDKANVYAYSFRKPEEGFRAKEIYYVHRILNILFPAHFPKIHAAFEQQSVDESRGGTVREEVQIAEEDEATKRRKSNPVYWVQKNYIDQTSEGDFAEVRNALIEMGITSGIDYNPPNFALDTRGHEQYLDTAPGLAEPFMNKAEVIVEYMTKHEYDESDIKRVQKALKRLSSLVKTRNYRKSASR